MTGLAAPLTVRCVQDFDGLQKLKDEWNQLAAVSSPGNLFATWQWQATWARHYLAPGQLHVVLVCDGQSVVGLAPFYIRRSPHRAILRGREIRFLGTEEVCSSYLDVLAASGRRTEVLTRLYRYLFEEAAGCWDILTLAELPSESPSIDLWQRLFDQDGKVLELLGFTACPVVDLRPGWDGVRQRIGRTARYNLARKTKYAQALGDLVVERYTDPDMIARHWEEYVALHRERWEARGEGGAFASHRFAAFHREMGRTLAARGWAELDFLSLNGERIAAIYGFDYEGTYSFYLPAMNPRVASKASPGALLLAQSIEAAAREGRHTYDLLQGLAEYKMVWAGRVRRSLTLQGYNRSVRAVLWKALDGITQAVKVLVR